MNFLLIISKKDYASVNFKKVLFENYNLKKINKNLFLLDEGFENKIFVDIIDQLHIFVKEKDLIDEYLKKESINQIIFLSKHSTSSEHKPKSMTVHAIGNWGKAELGGKDYTLVKTDPILIRSLLIELKKNKTKLVKKYEVKQEATHHGPYLDISTIFYEIGSNEEHWKNVDVSKYMLKILFSVIKNYNKDKIQTKNEWVPTVGIGGSHYCTRFNKLTFNEDNKFSFGHVVTNYALEDVKKYPELLEQAKDKSNSKKIIRNVDI